jgi:hypothetical protein
MICNADIIMVFLSSTSYQSLMHELNHNQPKTTKEFLTLPPGMPLVRRRSGLFSSKATRRRLPAAVGGTAQNRH